MSSPVSETSSAPHQSSKPSSVRLARSVGVIGSATMISRVLGLVRDQVLAYLFGAGNAMDAFTIGFRIPNLMRDLFAEGAMSAAFVPTFTRRMTTDGREVAWRLGNQLINALLLTTGILVIAGIIFAGPIVNMFAGDYANVPGKLELTTLLTRIMLPFLTLVTVAAALMGMLNAHQHFFTPALSPAMFNIAMIASGFGLVPLMPQFGLPPITGMAIGTLLGGFGQGFIQWMALRKQGYRYRLLLNPHDSGLQEVLRLMGPGTLGLAAVQINLLVNSILATGEGTGAVSWLSYAFRLMYLPIGLFGVSIATASLPQFSRMAALKNTTDMRKMISSSLRLMMMLNVPAAVGLMVLATPIIALIFERGSFTSADTAATAAALQCYAPGLIGYSTVKITAPIFYAMRDSRTPAVISGIAVALNLVLNLTLVRIMGYQGLALGTAIAAILNALILMILLHRRLDGIDGARLGITFIKIVVASIIMGSVAVVTERYLADIWPSALLSVQILRLSITIAASVLVLCGAAQALRMDEFNDARRRIIAKLTGTV